MRKRILRIGTGGTHLDSLAFRAIRSTVRMLAWRMFRLSTVGTDRIPSGPAVVVANHVSWLDPIILPLVMPRKPAVLAMAELWHMPGVRLVMRAYGPLAIPIRRGMVDTGALKRSLAALRDGHLLIVFPEGGISGDGRLRPFQRGAALLAARASVPIVPVAIVGTNDALPLGRVVPRPRRVVVRIGTPVTVRGDTPAGLDRANAEAESQIAALSAAP
ncbi:MAG TPA: lysophospholipid acyltransferase family protein [bacterium]|nr:lysophospholipid acyltransferase family protein [bacterium]